MILENLQIERIKWGDDKGKFLGGIKFTGASGEVSIKLNEEHCRQIFSICADALIGATKEAAEALTSNIINHQQLLGGAAELEREQSNESV